MNRNLEVDVNWEFSEMLKRLKGKGQFGTQETCEATLKAILAETGMRMLVFGISEGAALELQELTGGRVSPEPSKENK